MFVNITTAANMWNILGVGIGQFLYWVLIGMAWYIAHKSEYQKYALILIIFALFMRTTQLFGGGIIAESLRLSSLGGLFVIAGAKVYGNNYFLLHRQLVVFFALSIPVMLFQISGSSTVWMMWNTEYAHDPMILAIEEIGTFKEIPVYPTFFVELKDLYYQIGQGRPVGLLYSNNVLSFFLLILVALNIVIERAKKIKLSDFVVTIATVLTMSKMVFVLSFFLYIFFVFFGNKEKKKLAVNLFLLLTLEMFLYYYIFPGLFENLINRDRIMFSFLVRMLDLAPVLGIENFISYAFENDLELNSLEFTGVIGSTSQIAVILASKFSWAAIVFLLVLLMHYYQNIKKMNKVHANTKVYIVLAFVMLVSQLALTYVGAISYQFIAGVALYPIFRKMHIVEPRFN